MELEDGKIRQGIRRNCTLCQDDKKLEDIRYCHRVAYIKSAFNRSGIGWVTLCEGEI